MAQLVRTVQRVVHASPQEVFELLARPARHAEIDGSGTVVAADGGPERLALGSEFGMSMKATLKYTSTSRVIEFDEGRQIAWQSGYFRGDKLVVGGQVWRYELVDRGDGSTLVKESYDLTGARPRRVLDRLAGQPTEQNMKATLERMAQRFAA